MINYIVQLGLEAVWPAKLRMPLRREWTDALWHAHTALSNFRLMHEEEMQP